MGEKERGSFGKSFPEGGRVEQVLELGRAR